MPELGLFPLPLVLVPTERIPLHIFEPRYRELIAQCIEEGEEFGLVLATGDGAVHEIGTRAAVSQVLEELPDGRMNVVVEGGERFRLVELTSGRPFATAVVEDVYDDDDPPEDADTARALDLFGRLVFVLHRLDDPRLERPSTSQLEQPETLASLDDDVHAAVLEGLEHAGDPRARPDLVHGAVAGREHEPELPVRVEALLHELPVARLEDVQRDPLGREQDDRQREQAELSHAGRVRVGRTGRTGPAVQAPALFPGSRPGALTRVTA